MVWPEKEKDSVSESVHLLSGAQALPLTCIPTRTKKYSSNQHVELTQQLTLTHAQKLVFFARAVKSIETIDDVMGSARRHVVAI